MGKVAHRSVLALLTLLAASCYIMGMRDWGRRTWRFVDRDDGLPRELTVAFPGRDVTWWYERAFNGTAPEALPDIFLRPALWQVSWKGHEMRVFDPRRERFWPLITRGGTNLMLWFVVFGAYPAVWLFGGPWRRYRRRRRGLCLACGYDLTGNVSGVCPECGAKV